MVEQSSRSRSWSWCRSCSVSVVVSALGVSACGQPEPPPASPPAAPAPPATVAPVTGNKPAYPPAPRHDVVDTYGGGLVVHDEYRWLEDSNDQAVKDWSEAENALARKTLNALPGREAIGERLTQLMSETAPVWWGLFTRPHAVFFMEAKPPKQHPFLVTAPSLEAGPAAERVVFDPNLLDPSGKTSIGWSVPSFDGKRVAVSVATAGAERGDVHVFEVATGKDLGEAVPQLDGGIEGERALAWLRDGSGFYYTRGATEADKPAGGHGVFMRIWLHKLGTPVDKDVVVGGKDAPDIAQWDMRTSDDGRYVSVRMEPGDGGRFEQWLVDPAGKWTKVATVDDDIKAMFVGHGDTLYLLSVAGAPRGKILRTSLAHPSLAKTETVIPEGDAVIDSLTVTPHRLYLRETVGGPSRIRAFALPLTAGATATTLPTPPVSALADIQPLGGDEIAFSVVSYFQRAAWFRTTGGKDGALTKTAFAGTSAADFSGMEAVRETCTSKDGTKVPLNILRPKNARLDGTAPVLLTGYGGFGINYTPSFDKTLLPWLEAGGIYAIANVRGGGEYGETWHHGGNLLNKQNVFDDLYACAQRLVETHHTSPAHLAIEGASNGGLLMGAEIAQHPEMWKAVVSQVGIYDMLRLERDPNGAFNVTEYGSPKDPAQLQALAAYSPYHHVKEGVAYPAVLFTTGANDPRVMTYHSRKMVAKLQAATTSDAPILLRTEANAGHGIGSPLKMQIEERTDIYAFLFHELGLTYPAR